MPLFDFCIYKDRAWSKDFISVEGHSMREAAVRLVKITENSVTFAPRYQKKNRPPLVHHAGRVVNDKNPVFR